MKKYNIITLRSPQSMANAAAKEKEEEEEELALRSVRSDKLWWQIGRWGGRPGGGGSEIVINPSPNGTCPLRIWPPIHLSIHRTHQGLVYLPNRLLNNHQPAPSSTMHQKTASQVLTTSSPHCFVLCPYAVFVYIFLSSSSSLLASCPASYYT